MRTYYSHPGGEPEEVLLKSCGTYRIEGYAFTMLRRRDGSVLAIAEQLRSGRWVWLEEDEWPGELEDV